MTYVRVLACHPKVAGARMTSTVVGIGQVLAIGSMNILENSTYSVCFSCVNTMGVRSYNTSFEG